MPDELHHAIIRQAQTLKKVLQKLVLMSIFYTVFIIVKCITNPNYKEFDLEKYIKYTTYKLLTYLIVSAYYNSNYYLFKFILIFGLLAVILLFIWYILKIFIIAIYYKQISLMFIYSYEFHIFGLLVYDAFNILSI